MERHGEQEEDDSKSVRKFGSKGRNGEAAGPIAVAAMQRELRNKYGSRSRMW